jgi:hypothetical protein
VSQVLDEPFECQRADSELPTLIRGDVKLIRDVVVWKIASPPNPVPSDEPTTIPKLRNIMFRFGNHPGLEFVSDFSGVSCVEEHSRSRRLNVFSQHHELLRRLRTKGITVICQHLIRIRY